MVKVTFELDENLNQELRYIDRNLINKATLATLRKLSKPVLSDEKSMAPFDTQVLRDELSISAFINNKNHDVAVCHVGLSKKNHPAWLKTRGLAMEYGNLRVDPRHYLAQAADQNRDPTYREFSQFLNKHLDKLVAKA